MISAERDNDLYAFVGHANVDRDYEANGLNQYDEVGADTPTYDANGNLTDDDYTGFVYDPSNMLVGATPAATGSGNATLKYDPLGRLFEVADGSTTTQFLYDGTDLVGEYNSGGTLLARYLHGVGGGDDPLIAYSGTGVADSDLRQLYADRLGSIVLTTAYTGGSPQRSAYDAWGIPDAMNAGIGAGGDGRFQYTGQAWLPEVGLYHYKARMYSPTLGRFLQPDPIGYGDGLNMYAYVGNDPANFVDPTGMQSQCTLGGNVPSGADLSRYACFNGQYLLLYDGSDPTQKYCTTWVNGVGTDGICSGYKPFATSISCSNGGCNDFVNGFNNGGSYFPAPGDGSYGGSGDGGSDAPQNDRRDELRDRAVRAGCLSGRACLQAQITPAEMCASDAKASRTASDIAFGEFALAFGLAPASAIPVLPETTRALAPQAAAVLLADAARWAFVGKMADLHSDFIGCQATYTVSP